MIYLKSELDEFERTREKFKIHYFYHVDEMRSIVTIKGRVRDTQTPIHHRMSPVTMLALAQAKGRRIETLMSGSLVWWKEPQVSKVIEECIDVANYMLFIAALASMLRGDEILQSFEEEEPKCLSPT